MYGAGFFPGSSERQGRNCWRQANAPRKPESSLRNLVSHGYSLLVHHVKNIIKIITTKSNEHVLQELLRSRAVFQGSSSQYFGLSNSLDQTPSKPCETASTILSAESCPSRPNVPSALLKCAPLPPRLQRIAKMDAENDVLVGLATCSAVAPRPTNARSRPLFRRYPAPSHLEVQALLEFIEGVQVRASKKNLTL